jgi:deoxyribonuclease-4
VDTGQKKFIGAHVSTTGGVENAPINAADIGAKAFALFTKNQRQWKSPPLIPESVALFKERMRQATFVSDYVLPHDSYLINIGNPIKEKREQSLQAFIDELIRVETLGLTMLNFHPGAHLAQATEKECLAVIADGINLSIENTDSATLVIEVTAGQGTNVGYRFEHIAEIIDQVKNQSRIGVCIDTCHVFAAGYDIRTREAHENTFEQFEKIIGFSLLRGVHLNDSKKDLGSKVDRHECIGKGYLGLQPFEMIVNDSRFDSIPLILETPDKTPEKSIWPEEIKTLYAMQKDPAY